MGVSNGKLRSVAALYRVSPRSFLSDLVFVDLFFSYDCLTDCSQLNVSEKIRLLSKYFGGQAAMIEDIETLCDTVCEMDKGVLTVLR